MLAEPTPSRGEKADAAEVARIGFDAMMKCETKMVAGAGNKMRAAMTNVLPDKTLAKIHTGMSKPGTAKDR